MNGTYLIVATHTIPGCCGYQLYKTRVSRLKDARSEVLRLLNGRFNEKRHDVLCIDRVSSALYNAIDAEWIRD